MRIAFIIPDKMPSSEHSDNLLEYQCDAVHQGIGYVAAYANKHFPVDECQVLRTSDATEKELISFLEQKWDVIGITLSLFSLREAAEISGIIKSIGPTKIVVGGAEVSAIQEEVLRLCPHVDYAIYGEGEITFCELLWCIKNGGDLLKIDGFIFRDENGNILKNPAREFENDLDVFPYPDRGLFRYQYDYHSIIGTRGCPFRCTFCNSSRVWGHKYRLRNPESIFDELKYILELFGNNKLFIFQDDTFNYNKKWMEDVCNVIKELRISWRIRGFRASLATDDIAELLKESGCVGLSCGVESANNDALIAMKKGSTFEEILKGVNVLQNKGIPVVGNFMIGNLGDTLETVKESLEYAHLFSQADFRITYPIPYTYLYDYLRANNLFLSEPIPIRFKDTVVGRILFHTPEFPI
jgi:anaerobic magnesium-protoporphyrin IX monomethyl ester cyclase